VFEAALPIAEQATIAVVRTGYIFKSYYWGSSIVGPLIGERRFGGLLKMQQSTGRVSGARGLGFHSRVYGDIRI
jgi:hypothetical protein